MKQYIQILEMFLAIDRPEWMKKTFNWEGKTIATNGVTLVAVPLQDGFAENSNASKAYPLDHIIDVEIQVSAIKEKLALFPLIDDCDEKDCDACNGSGEVDFDFFHNGTTYEMSGECPVCEAEGVFSTPNGKTVLDQDYFFQIGNSKFDVLRIEELVKVAEILESETIKLVNQTEPNKMNLFVIKDVEMIIMPCLVGHPDDVLQTIEI